MQTGERFSIFLKILLPLLILMLLQAYPASRSVNAGLQEARVARQDGRHQDAARALRQVLSLEPWRTGLWEQAGREDFLAGRWTGAVDALQKARNAGELSTDGQFVLGEAQYQLGDARAAQSTWQVLLEETETGYEARIYERLAQIRRAGGDLQGAVEALRAWRQFEPQNARVAFLLGLHLAALQPQQALPLLLQAAEQDPAYKPATETLQRGIDQAANAEQPSYGWLMIGRALGSTGHWDLAEVAFRQALDGAPYYAEAWAFLSEARYQQTGDGKAELDKASELGPDSTIVRAFQALNFRRQGNPQQALSVLEEVARREPREPMWQVEIAHTLVEIGDLVAAHERYQKAVDMAPKQAIYWQYLARFSADYHYNIRLLGLPAARQAVLLAPDDPGALDVMGWTLYQLSDFASAERFLQRAVEKNAAYAPALLHLGQLYLQQQEMQQAHAYLRMAAREAGQDPVGGLARRLLKKYFNEGG